MDGWCLMYHRNRVKTVANALHCSNMPNADTLHFWMYVEETEQDDTKWVFSLNDFEAWNKLNNQWLLPSLQKNNKSVKYGLQGQCYSSWGLLGGCWYRDKGKEDCWSEVKQLSKHRHASWWVCERVSVLGAVGGDGRAGGGGVEGGLRPQPFCGLLPTIRPEKREVNRHMLPMMSIADHKLQRVAMSWC